jgi:hypothetical protein
VNYSWFAYYLPEDIWFAICLEMLLLAAETNACPRRVFLA